MDMDTRTDQITSTGIIFTRLLTYMFLISSWETGKCSKIFCISFVNLNCVEKRLQMSKLAEHVHICKCRKVLRSGKIWKTRTKLKLRSNKFEFVINAQLCDIIFHLYSRSSDVVEEIWFLKNHVENVVFVHHTIKHICLRYV